MAESAQVIESQFEDLKKLEHYATIAISGNAGSVVLNMTGGDFVNPPTMMVVKEKGAAGTYTPVYLAGSPSTITVTVSGETVLNNLTTKVIVVAYDRG